MSVNPGNQAGKKPLSRKPSFKNRKPPEIKHTLTSKYRMLKANPLLLSELEKAVLNSNGTGHQESLILDKPLKTLAPFFDANSVKTTFDFSSKEKIEKPPRKVQIYSRSKTNFSTSSNVSKIDFGSGPLLSSTVIENNRRESSKKQTVVVKKTIEKKPVRRSLSAENVDRKKMNVSTLSTPIKSTQSMERLQQVTQNHEKFNNHSVIAEESSFNKTPKASSSGFKTPASNRKSLFLNTPTPEQLLDRLNSWLKRRGKSLGEYHHLKCFGAHNSKKKQPINEENKENEEANIANSDSNSYKDLSIDIQIHKPPEDVPLNLENIARDALQDLHKLILHGYPSEQCEIWLNVIKNKYKKLEEESLYWECRAALEQAKGNINLAVECYKTAIVQGAEVAVVDKSLDQLLQKFSLLNIDQDSKETNKGRSKIIEDARNIFKSSIIKFAVQERTLKKKNNDGTVLEKKLYATPVRRSTRLSRSKYTSTPGIKLYSTFHEAENDTNDEINFKSNKALKN